MSSDEQTHLHVVRLVPRHVLRGKVPREDYGLAEVLQSEGNGGGGELEILDGVQDHETVEIRVIGVDCVQKTFPKTGYRERRDAVVRETASLWKLDQGRESCARGVRSIVSSKLGN